MIELINIRKKYKNRKLFSEVNLKIDKPGIYSFIGNNGSGKTTLLNIISKFIKPSSGNVKLSNKSISFLSQNVNLLEMLTVREHLEMFSIDINVLKKVNLTSKIDKYPKELSFGMRQRIAVLISLHSKSNIIILDEPTSHLDAYNTNILIREIKKVSEHKIVLLVSHDKKLIDRFSDEIYCICNQRLTLIKTNNNKRKLLNSKKQKIVFNKYIKKSFNYNKRINVYYFMVILFLSITLNFTSNLKNNFLNVMQTSESTSLDYNKFYLKECITQIKSDIKIKKCSNLSDKNIETLSNSANLLSLNYDILLNNLYQKDDLSVINRQVALKEGRYPNSFNEVMTTSNYSLNEEITLETTKVINHKKTDIYKDKLKLKVVGIIDNNHLMPDNKLYFYYDYVHQYFKDKKLINNDISIYEYFKNIDIDNYKYVLYFQYIDIDFLDDLNIDYLSSSYQYIQSLKQTFKEIDNAMNYFNIFTITFSFIYIVRTTKKKVKSKHDDIIFFKAAGVSKKKLSKIIGIENRILAIFAIFLGEMFITLLLKIFFSSLIIDYTTCFLLIIFILLLNDKILNKEIKRRVSI